MSPQRYEPVQSHDDDDETVLTPATTHTIPSSPPPSFRSRTSSPASRHHAEDQLLEDRDQTLADAFDDGEGSDTDDDAGDDRQRLMRAGHEPHADSPSSEPLVSTGRTAPQIVRTITEFPGISISPGIRTQRSTNDGVFANLAAKPERGEKLDEQPPTYEQAAADSAPPYWETTIVAPGMASDEVYVDGLPVGSVFSFIWNGMISMSFQFVGFLLTYLLHTTHAAKNGSRAGLGLTLIQYGFYMKGAVGRPSSETGDPSQFAGAPTDPNAHDFDPNAVTSDPATGGDSGGSSAGGISSLATSEWLSYILMIVGWFILIRAVSDFLRARRHEQLVLQSPNRGLPVPVVAEGETTETAV